MRMSAKDYRGLVKGTVSKTAHQEVVHQKNKGAQDRSGCAAFTGVSNTARLHVDCDGKKKNTTQSLRIWDQK